MPVALVVSHPANMPGYNSTVDLEEVQSLSRYCFFSISNSRTFISSVHVAQKSCLFILLAFLFFFVITHGSCLPSGLFPPGH